MEATIVNGLFLIAVALIELRAGRDRKNQKKLQEEQAAHEQLRREEMELQLQMTSANTKLVKVIAKTVQHQKTNGDVEEAYRAVQESQDAYFHFLNKVAVERLEGE